MPLIVLPRLGLLEILGIDTAHEWQDDIELPALADGMLGEDHVSPLG